MNPIKAPIYQTLQIREFERLAEERFGISGATLMQRAGKAAFDFILRRFPHAQKIAVFCGSGNNGGDGYIVARLLHERGLKVSVWQVGSPDKLQEAAKLALESCQKHNMPITPFNEKEDLGHPDLIIDAICGIGLHEALREDVVTAIEKMSRTHAPIFSIDIPTGIDADTGRILGAAVRATATMTFIGLKLGLLTGNGIAYTGELAFNDLQFPMELFSYVEPIAEKIIIHSYMDYLKPRSRDWHKGLSGHVLVIGGELGFAGAPRMAGEAALRVGAGLVSIATHPKHAATLTLGCPEIMCHGIDKIEDLKILIDKADVLVLGPGLAQTAWSTMVWDYALKADLPMVVDADGLNLLAKKNKFNDNWVLTPHPGEAARLLGGTAEVIQQDRLSALKLLNKKYGGVVVLKAAGSLILAPNSLPALCDKGNPGMASAGMGDVLSGVIGGFISQGIPLGDAAKLGVYVHASAGDLAAKEGERGMIAMDLMPFIRRLSNSSSWDKNFKINE